MKPPFPILFIPKTLFINANTKVKVSVTCNAAYTPVALTLPSAHCLCGRIHDHCSCTQRDTRNRDRGVSAIMLACSNTIVGC